MENLTFGACMRNSWVSTFKFAVRVPWFVTGFSIVMAMVTGLTGLIPSKIDSPTFSIIVIVLLSLPILLFAYPWIYFKACRFVILDEGISPFVPLADARLGRAILVYVFCGAAMLAVPMLFSGLVLSGALAFDRPVHRWVCAIAFIAAALLVSRIILAFVAAALGQGLDFRSAWRNSKGHVLVITTAVFTNAIPLTVLWSYFGLIGGVQDAFSDSVSPLTLIVALATPLVLVQSACTVSWLYRRCVSQRSHGEPD